MNPSQMAIRMGAFDGDPGVRPSFRMFVASAAVWEPIPDDGLPRYDGRKTARAPAAVSNPFSASQDETRGIACAFTSWSPRARGGVRSMRALRLRVACWHETATIWHMSTHVAPAAAGSCREP